ncbi:hypothetical protein AMECASPLE_036509 [Ameca splendens]|uniref:Uncharacterized protein n=1 Tax=Ameca splendens TaxID=208324 RepID=A0ABV0YUU7_9TELE
MHAGRRSSSFTTKNRRCPNKLKPFLASYQSACYGNIVSAQQCFILQCSLDPIGPSLVPVVGLDEGQPVPYPRRRREIHHTLCLVRYKNWILMFLLWRSEMLRSQTTCLSYLIFCFSVLR